MIEAKDIRSTNLVCWNRHDKELDNEIVEIYNIQRSSIRVYTKIEELQEVLIRYEDIEPIPLTEEWWHKFGYECIQEFVMDLEEKSILSVEINFTRMVQDIEGLPIHKIQNLWNTFTGRELTIKE